jgi:hypothetical protein
MQRALAAVLMLGLVASLGALCPCPERPAVPLDDHGCCALDGLQPATTCCFDAPAAQPSGSLDAAPPLVAPQPMASPLGASRARLAAAVARSQVPRSAPPTVSLRI